ncbi:toll/interleukin-1 receptor domain-containing protein [Streptomyces sp. NBC_00555]|uniref:toll/interleukin-1 receptor domain-containing protein n=1 Tax=Streptomyces sp. NBC_00555 TaxID=2903662 RepID=UPI0022595577|nr:toll/interleukin-1 receptor domain-containing protein [Streptomyces sp. NBC_00555]MCX5014250.1 toll/interleukin-1 receptor domain-containing protein [Streptomyces sp. NBC_00555]
MAKAQPAGFWSYTHRDDQLDGGRIIRLSERIAHAFEIITGEPLEIFLDKKSIEWGDAWRGRLDSALTATTFLIPVVTPKFLNSQECRREVITFAGHAASLGLEELLLPILYVDVPQLAGSSGTEPDDEVVELIARRQWVDWRDLRLEDEDSPQYRKAVHKLALRLSEISEAAPPPTPLQPAGAKDSSEDPLGFIEIMAEMEQAFPAWVDTFEQFSGVIAHIGEQTGWATSEMTNSDSTGGGFTGRVRVTEELASRLVKPVGEVDALGAKYWAELASIDPGIIRFIRYAAETDLSIEDQQNVREFFKGVNGLAYASMRITRKAQGFSKSVAGIAEGNRRLRPQFKTIQAAVQKFIDGQTIIDEWSRMIRDLDLDLAGDR